MVWLVIIMVPKAGIKGFKFFWAVKVPMQGIHHRICHFAPLADFLQVCVDHSPLPKKMESYPGSISYLKSKRNKQRKKFCGAENSFCIARGLCITRAMTDSNPVIDRK